MKNKVYILLIMIILLGPAGRAFADAIVSRPSREEKLKAAFIYNFIRFVDRTDEEKIEEGFDKWIHRAS